MSSAPDLPAVEATAPAAAPDASFASALRAFPPGTRVDAGVACAGEVLRFPPRAAWLWVPLAATAAGCYRLEIAATGAAGLRAELVTEDGPVALPLEPAGQRFALVLALEAPVAWLRLMPVEAGEVGFAAFAFAPCAPWRSILPDWRIGPVRLPMRQGAPAPAAGAPAPASWQAGVSIAATEALELAGEAAECGRCGALRLAFAAPLAAGHHLVMADFVDPDDGAPALVAPRLYADAAPPNAMPLAHFRRRAGARYVARLHLEAPATHLVLQPRQERGRVAIRGLRTHRLSRIGRAFSLAGEGWRLFSHRLAAPLERLVGLDPGADGPLAAVVRLATRADLRYRRSLARTEPARIRRLLREPVRNAGELRIAIGPGSEADRAATRASLVACGDASWREVGAADAPDLVLDAGTRLPPHALAALRRTAPTATPAALHTDRIVLGLRSAPHFVAGAAAPLVLAHTPRRPAAAASPRPAAPAPPAPPVRATVVTATRDAPAHLARFLATWRASRPAGTDLVLIDNASADPAALALLEGAAADPDIAVVADDRPFNFAALCNLGAALASGDFLIFANNDIEFRYAGWAEALIAALASGGAGVAGGLLDYPDGRVQHAGMVLAGEARVRHLERFSRAGDGGYFARRRQLTQVTAVTGALMAVRRADFAALGGFAAARYPVLYNDVDFCLRARQAGHAVVLASGARAVHHESVTLNLRDRGAVWRMERAIEADRFRQDWARHTDDDPCYPSVCDPVEAAFRAGQ